VRTPLGATLFAAVVALGLGGCETATSLFGSSADPEVPPIAADGTLPAVASQPARIAIAPIIGAPDAIGKQMQAELGAAIEKRNVSVAKAPGDKAEYTLRGYIVSARERSGTKISYIWDVTDVANKRINRITGEEVISGAEGKDPWASVTPQVVAKIVDTTAGSLTSWLATQSPPSVAANTPPPSAVAGAVETAATAPPDSPPPPAAPAAPPKAKPQAAVPTTGSIGGREGPINALVPSVTGAPGDGSVTLTSALQRELSRNGVALTDKPTGQSYRVEGKVMVGEGKDGKQPIQIDWNVKDPQGKKVGTVSQKNEIAQGSLDGAWGKTADAIAAAAAQGILKLLPPQTKTN
jgi:hypothetical protein